MTSALSHVESYEFEYFTTNLRRMMLVMEALLALSGCSRVNLTRKRHSQGSYTDQEDDTDLPLGAHLQLPDHRQRKEQDDDVFRNAESCTSEANNS
jgi:hypothetical protein